VLPPVVERELRVALLRRKARSQWLKAAWAAGGVTFWFLILLALSSRRHIGSTLFNILFALGCGAVVVRGFSLTADLLSEERRNGTLGLLVLTGLTPLEIFANKLLGAVFLTAYGLLGALPFFAIPFLAGGVSNIQFLCALVFLTNALLFCIAVGLLASVLHGEGGQAQITALVITAALCLAAPIARWISDSALGIRAFPQEWVASSPAYGAYLVFNNFSGTSPRVFWSNSALMLSYSLIALLFAALILQHTWRDGPETLAPKAWRDRWQNWTRGSAIWQRRLRARLLFRNPFSWLAARDRGPVLAAQAVLAVAGLAWAAIFLLGVRRRFVTGDAILASIIVHQVLNWILAYAAGKRFAEERQSGGFEILLTTPVDVWSIIDGQNKGLIIQFKSVWLMALALDAVFMWSGFAAGGWETPAIVSYVCAWSVLVLLWFAVHLETASRAMWISAWTGRPGYAAIHAMKANLWNLLFLWFICMGGLGRNPQRHVIGLMVIAILLAFLVMGVFSSRRFLREKLGLELRAIASAPIPARGEKRFKGWNPKAIYPPGRWGYFELKAVKPISRN
jgi:hypothetical protein